MQIRPLLLLIAVVVLTPAFVAASLAVEKVRQGERQAALEGLRETVRATSLLVDGEVQRSLGALTALGDSPYLKTGDMRPFYAQATEVNQPPDVWTVLLDANGQQILNTALPYGAALPQPRTGERIKRVLASGKPLVTDVVVGITTGKLLTMIYMPAKASPNYVVAQAFSVEHWKRAALQPQGRSDLTVAVIDKAGKFIARNKHTNALLGQSARPELVQAAAVAQEGLIRHKTLEGIESYDAFTHSKLTGWTIAVALPVASVEASANQAVVWLVAGIVSAMAIALGVSILFGRKFVEFIDVTTAAARLLSSGAIPPLRPARLREVNALNDALAQAGRVLANEKASREALEIERTSLLNNEIAAKERAQAENAAKDRFLALLGHELRNPLAAINGATEVLMLKRDLASADFDRYMDMIKRQNRSLTRIVDDLLDVSRMLSGRIALQREPLNLAVCVSACVDALQTSGSAGPSQLKLSTEDVWADCDPIRMEQIINNLLTNAIKFSSPQAPINISVRQQGALALIEVTDRGLGIEAELMPHIFEPFVQGPHLRGQVHSGLGIGLALVKQLVSLHDGTVAAESAGHGLGSTFKVTLPLSLARDIALEKTAGPSTSSGARRCVLLVEDNPDALEATAALLDLLGYDVVTARDGDEAVQAVRLRAPDVVLMDIGLPGKDGYQVTSEIRALPTDRHIPVIALSGYGQYSLKDQATFDGFLIKPINTDELSEAIERIFQLRP